MCTRESVCTSPKIYELIQHLGARGVLDCCSVFTARGRRLIALLTLLSCA